MEYNEQRGLIQKYSQTSLDERPIKKDVAAINIKDIR